MLFQLNRFTFKGQPSTTYTVTELDGSTKATYSDADGLNSSGGTISTDAQGTGYTYFHGDAQLRLGGMVVRDQIRNGYEFTSPADPNQTGAVCRAITLLTPEELAEVQAAQDGVPSIDLAPKLQAWFDDALAVYGDGTSGTGGRGARMELDAGDWLISTLQLRPGCSLVGRASRYEVRLLQTNDSQDPIIDILGRADNTDVVQRRTEVYLENLDINANGNLDALGDPINGINLRAEGTDGDDPVDPDDLVNRTGVIAHRVQVGGASGYGFYSLKRGRNWLHECQFAGNGTAGENNCGGLFAQGPDQLFVKCYCGSNYGHQLHIKSSATPMVVEVELGTSKTPQTFVSLYMENCTDSVIQGGNCTGQMLFEGQEDDNTANEYDTETRINLSNVVFTFKDKTFTDQDTDIVYTLDGFIINKNLRGLSINNCRFKPATDDDIAAHHYTNRPTYVVYMQGVRSRAVFNCPLPPLDDWNWPAGTPEVYAGTPTNTYDSITNQPGRLLIQTTDTTEDTHAFLFERIRFLYGGGIVGITDGSDVDAGIVGELFSTEVDSGAPVALTTATVASLGSVALTAGNWEVRAAAVFVGSGATVTQMESGVASNNNSISATSAKRYTGQMANFVTTSGNLATHQIGPYELQLSSAGTRYLNVAATFSAGTMTAYGVIEARRVS